MPIKTEKPITIEQPNVLAVEGKEDKQFFGALIDHLGLMEVQVLPIGGKDQLRRNLNALISSPNFDIVASLGVVRDANDNPGGAFQSVCDALRSVDLPAPEHSLIPTGHSPQVTVMILPAQDEPGMLEDVCIESEEQNPAMVCVEQYFECLKQKDLSLPKNESKARVQVFLASKPEAGKQLVKQPRRDTCRGIMRLSIR